MSWKKYKEKFIQGESSEAYFILGVDIGNANSTVAFYDINRGIPEIIDMSGGYGKPSPPTVLQYAAETNEWIFGEYAITAELGEKDFSFKSMVERLGRGEYTDVNGKAVPLTKVLSIYLKELIGNVKNINPKAEIAGIVASVPGYLPDEARSELTEAYRLAGFDKPLIALADDRECILNRYYHDKKEFTQERALIIDFGSRELRAGIYDIKPDSAGGINASCLSFFFDKELGVSRAESLATSLFTDAYCDSLGIKKNALDKQQQSLLEVFSYKHKDLLFQNSGKAVKLYYNFAYPPFPVSMPYERIEALISPIRHGMDVFFAELFGKCTGRLMPRDINTVICVGGGFEMLFVRQQIERMFGSAEIVCYKNPKGAIAEGASLICAKELAVRAAGAFAISDDNRLTYDIGFGATVGNTERFVPLCARNSFWWQEHERRNVMLASDDTNAELELLARDTLGNTRSLQTLMLDGLPNRPSGALRLMLSLEFENATAVTAYIKDTGFGELFASGGKEWRFDLKI